MVFDLFSHYYHNSNRVNVPVFSDCKVRFTPSRSAGATPSPTSRLTRQALEEFNNSPQLAGQTSPIERLQMENSRQGTPEVRHETPEVVRAPSANASPNLLSSSKRHHQTPEHNATESRVESRITDLSPERSVLTESKARSPLGDSKACSTPLKGQNSFNHDLDNSNISSVSQNTRCTTPTLVSAQGAGAPTAHSQQQGWAAPSTVAPSTQVSTFVAPSSLVSSFAPTSVAPAPSSVVTDVTVQFNATPSAQYNATPSAHSCSYTPTAAPNYATPASVQKSYATPSSGQYKTTPPGAHPSAYAPTHAHSAVRRYDGAAFATTAQQYKSDGGEERYSVTDYFRKYTAGPSSVVTSSDRYDLDTTSVSTLVDDSKSDITLTSSVSSINSQDDRSFRAGLANLDANIARLQMALKTSSMR